MFLSRIIGLHYTDEGLFYFLVFLKNGFKSIFSKRQKVNFFTFFHTTFHFN